MRKRELVKGPDGLCACRTCTDPAAAVALDLALALESEPDRREVPELRPVSLVAMIDELPEWAPPPPCVGCGALSTRKVGMVGRELRPVCAACADAIAAALARKYGEVAS